MVSKQTCLLQKPILVFALLFLAGEGVLSDISSATTPLQTQPPQSKTQDVVGTFLHFATKKLLQVCHSSNSDVHLPTSIDEFLSEVQKQTGLSSSELADSLTPMSVPDFAISLAQLGVKVLNSNMTNEFTNLFSVSTIMQCAPRFAVALLKAAQSFPNEPKLDVTEDGQSLLQLEVIAVNSSSWSYDRHAKSFSTIALALSGLSTVAAGVAWVVALKQLFSGFIAMRQLATYEMDQALLKGGEQLDEVLYHIKFFPVSLSHHPDPLHPPDRMSENNAALTLREMQEHSTSQINEEISQIEHDIQLLESQAKDVPELTSESALEVKSRLLAVVQHVQEDTRNGGELEESRRQNLLAAILDAGVVLGLTSEKKLVISEALKANKVSVVSRILTDSPDILQQIQELYVAKQMLNQVLASRVTNLKRSRDLLSQLPVSHSDRTESSGATWDDTEAQKQLTLKNRISAWNAFVLPELSAKRPPSKALQKIRDGESEQPGNEKTSFMNKEWRLFLRKSLEDYGMRFLNPSNLHWAELLEPTNEHRTYHVPIQFFAWRLSSESTDFKQECKQIRQFFVDSKIEQLPVVWFEAAEEFIESSVKLKLRDHQRFNFWRKSIALFKGDLKVKFDKYELTPGQRLTLSQISLAAQLKSMSRLTQAFTTVLGSSIGLYFLTGAIREASQGMYRLSIPCTRRDPNRVYKVLGRYVPGPACPQYGQATFKNFFESGTQDTYWQTVSALIEFVFPAVDSSLAGHLTVLYRCNNDTNTIVGERKVTYEEPDVDILDPTVAIPSCPISAAIPSFQSLYESVAPTMRDSPSFLETHVIEQQQQQEQMRRTQARSNSNKNSISSSFSSFVKNTLPVLLQISSNSGISTFNKVHSALTKGDLSTPAQFAQQNPALVKKLASISIPGSDHVVGNFANWFTALESKQTFRPAAPEQDDDGELVEEEDKTLEDSTTTTAQVPTPTKATSNTDTAVVSFLEEKMIGPRRLGLELAVGGILSFAMYTTAIALTMIPQSDTSTLASWTQMRTNLITRFLLSKQWWMCGSLALMVLMFLAIASITYVSDVPVVTVSSASA